MGLSEDLWWVILRLILIPSCRVQECSIQDVVHSHGHGLSGMDQGAAAGLQAGSEP